MLSRKLFSLIHKIALFAVLFASLAPSISHALAAKQGVNSFAPEICTTDGRVIKIEVLTTQGQQIDTQLGADQSQQDAPVNIVHHLNHCPFCANPNVDTALEPSHALIVAQLTYEAQQLAIYTSVALPRFSVLPPPAQAPPSL